MSQISDTHNRKNSSKFQRGYSEVQLSHSVVNVASTPPKSTSSSAHSSPAPARTLSSLFRSKLPPSPLSMKWDKSNGHPASPTKSLRYKRLMPSPVRSNRVLRWLWVVALVLIMWGLFRYKDRDRVKFDLAKILGHLSGRNPSNLMLPDPLPVPKGRKAKVIKTDHTYEELIRLPSTLDLPMSDTISLTVLIHLSSAAHVLRLPKLLSTLKPQSFQPRDVVIIHPDTLTSAVQAEIGSQLSSSLRLAPAYESSSHPALAVVDTGRRAVSDFLLLLNGDAELSDDQLFEFMIRSAGTVEYGAAILTLAGSIFSADSASSNAPLLKSLCSLARASVVHLPLTPLLLQTSWLTSNALTSGLRTDFSLETALALVLWQKTGIGSFALPSQSDIAQSSSCVDPGLAPEDFQWISKSFMPPTVKHESYQEATSEDLLAGKGQDPVAFIISNSQDMLAFRDLICLLSNRIKGLIEVLSFGLDAETLRSIQSEHFECHFRIRPLRISHPDMSTIKVAIFALEEFGIDVFLKGLNDPSLVRLALPRNELSQMSWIGTLSTEALRQWHTPKIDLTIVTNNRASSLARLLDSLQKAHYLGDPVNIAINLEQTADRITRNIAGGFEWPFGVVTLRHRIVLGGLMPAIVESWYPTNNDSYGVFLEDDVEVSPLYYAWIKYTILHYRYTSSMRRQSRRLFGVSLYQQKAIELRPEGRRPFDAHLLFDSLALPSSIPYLSQIPCSWGAVYFPEQWREFHDYLTLRLSEVSIDLSEIVVPDIRSNRWPRSWKKYFIELVYVRGYTMLYPNYPDFVSFSTNHLEIGEHVKLKEMTWDSVAKDAKRKAAFEVPLMQPTGGLLIGLPDDQLPGWGQLPVLDLWGSMATEDELVSRGWRDINRLGTCTAHLRNEDEVFAGLDYDAYDLLCPRIHRRLFDPEAQLALHPASATLKRPMATPAATIRPIIYPDRSEERRTAVRPQYAFEPAEEDFAHRHRQDETGESFDSRDKILAPAEHRSDDESIANTDETTDL